MSEVVTDNNVEARALAWADRLSAGPQAAIRSIKEAVNASFSQPLQQRLEFERARFALLFDEPDKTEGIAARMDRRPSRFQC